MTVIRPATGADLDAVVSLERAVFERDAWSPRSIEEEFASLGSDRDALVALAGSTVVAYALSSYTADTSDLRRMAVAQGYRRRGIANRLLTQLLELLWEKGCERVLIEVAADNEPALSLYRDLGFTEVARRRRYYSGAIDAVVMQLQAAPDGAGASS